MRDWQGKRYWIVGASTGLGREVAKEISKTGAEVILSARNEEALNDLASGLPGRSIVQPMDVSSAESVAAAAKNVGQVMVWSILLAYTGRLEPPSLMAKKSPQCWMSI